MHFGTVKPLDTKAILAVASKVRVVVTIEEHQVAGGFGGAVTEYLSEVRPTKVVRLGMQDEFGQSGEPDELAAHYKLDAVGIADAARQALT